MSAIEVRPFRRSDRDQLTQLVNMHAAAVVPGMGASVSAVLSVLERRPGEFIEDPWVSERVTLVAEQNSRIAAAAHLLRYFPDDRRPAVGRKPAGTARPGGVRRVRIGRRRAIYAGRVRSTRAMAARQRPVRASRVHHAGHTEIVYHAKVEDLRGPAEAPIAGLSLRRTVGMNGTRLSAMLGGDAIGYIEVEIFDAGERLSRNGGLADIGNLHVNELYRRRGVGAFLLRQAAEWLSAAKVDRLLAYAWLEGTDPGGQDYADDRVFLPAAGFQELTRTRRGWNRAPRKP